MSCEESEKGVYTVLKLKISGQKHRSFLVSQLSPEGYLNEERPGSGEGERNSSCLISQWSTEEFLLPGR